MAQHAYIDHAADKFILTGLTRTFQIEEIAPIKPINVGLTIRERLLGHTIDTPERIRLLGQAGKKVKIGKIKANGFLIAAIALKG